MSQIFPKGYVFGFDPNEENGIRMTDLADVNMNGIKDGQVLKYNILSRGFEPSNMEGGGSGTTDYENLENKPSINGTELTGNKTLSELGILSQLQINALVEPKADKTYVDEELADKQDKLTAGSNITITEDGVISAQTGGSGGTSDYRDLENKPQINGVTLSGSKTSADLSMYTKNEVDTKLALKADKSLSMRYDSVHSKPQYYDANDGQWKDVESEAETAKSILNVARNITITPGFGILTVTIKDNSNHIALLKGVYNATDDAVDIPMVGCYRGSGGSSTYFEGHYVKSTGEAMGHLNIYYSGGSTTNFDITTAAFNSSSCVIVEGSTPTPGTEKQFYYTKADIPNSVWAAMAGGSYPITLLGSNAFECKFTMNGGEIIAGTGGDILMNEYGEMATIVVDYTNQKATVHAWRDQEYLAPIITAGEILRFPHMSFSSNPSTGFTPITANLDTSKKFHKLTYTLTTKRRYPDGTEKNTSDTTYQVLILQGDTGFTPIQLHAPYNIQYQGLDYNASTGVATLSALQMNNSYDVTQDSCLKFTGGTVTITEEW